MRHQYVLSWLAIAISAAHFASIDRAPSELANDIHAATSVREEHFALELDSPTEGAAPRVGLALLRRSKIGDETLLEWDVRFEDEGARVLQVERVSEHGTKLVWREFGGSRGRTVMCELGDSAPDLRVVEWADERRREDIRLESGVLTPLALLELARNGDLCDGVQRWFDPLSTSIEPVELISHYEGRPDEAADSGADAWLVRRDFALTRTDGTRAWSASFSGDDLVEFRWQGGGLRARRIERAEYQDELELYDVDVDSASTKAPPR